MSSNTLKGRNMPNVFIFIAIRVTDQKIHLMQLHRAMYIKPFLTFNIVVTAHDVVLLSYSTQCLKKKCTIFAHYNNILCLQFTDTYFHRRYFVNTFFNFLINIVFKITGFTEKIIPDRYVIIP